MNQKKRITYLIVFAFILLLLPEIVSAKSVKNDGQVCVGNMTYTITGAGAKVNLAKLNVEDILQSCYLQNGKCPGAEYKFQHQYLGVACGITNGGIGDDNYEFSSCPLESDKARVAAMDKVNESLTQEWNPALGKWRVTIAKASGYKVKRVDRQNTDGGKLSPYRQTCTAQLNGVCVQYEFPGNTYYTPDASGAITFYVSPGDDYFLAFYLNLGGGNVCDNGYMGYIQGAGSSLVPNSFYNTNTCTNYRNQIASSGSAESGIASALVSICFEKQVSYSKLSQYNEKKIQDEIANANNIFANLSNGTVSDNLQCSFNKDKNSNVGVGSASSKSYTQFLSGVGGTYWKALCTETMVISYEQPKGISAGQGFSYSPTIKMERTCTPIQIKQPQKKDLCSYGIECWGGPANHTGEPGAGPTKEFDGCIQKCDGGSYSQKCIDSCYKETYTNDVPNAVSSPLFGLGNLYDKNNNVVPVGTNNLGNSSAECNNIIGKPYGPTRLPLSSCQVTVNNTGCPTSTACKSEHGILFTYLDSCNSSASPTKCYEVFTSSPDCSTNPDADYQIEIEKSLAELKEVNAAISSYTSESETLKNENFSASIVDSHTGKTQEYKDATGASVQVTAKTTDGKDYTSAITKTVPQKVGDRTIDLNTYQVTRELKLKLDYGYVSKTTAYNTIYGKQYYETRPSDIQKKYYPGEQKYFTHINAKGINLYELWPTVIGFDNENAITENNASLKQNIKYAFDKVGSWSQWSNINLDCFYGIKDDTCINCPNISFIYRPIDLTSPFVERDPRWNWSTTATNKKYNINPTETLDEIKGKGYDIYRTSNQENETGNKDLDYEIVLTKQNINAIRQYNKEKGGEYLNYDMYCYQKDGANVCRSSLLGNEYASNDTYMRILKRGLIGCNNQAGPDSCDREYTDVRGTK